MTETGLKICRQEGCTVATGGQCLEGLSLENCPHAEHLEADGIEEEELEEIDEPAISEVDAPGKEGIAGDLSQNTQLFYDGNELSEEDAYKIMASTLSKLILFAGQAASGKTTLLASIYEMFQQGPYGGYLFAGSRTLCGFENRCFLSRIECGNDEADTERTKPSWDQKLLHLALQEVSLSKPLENVFFTDISGEIFTRALSDINEMQRLTMIKRSDHFVLVIDGGKLSNLTTRHDTAHISQLLLRSSFESGMISSHTYLDVVFSKYDVIQGVGRSTDTEAFIDHIQDQISKRYGHLAAKLRFYCVAARSKDESRVTTGYGIEPLFTSWVSESSAFERRAIQKPYEPDIERLSAFDRYHLNAS